MEPSGRHYLIDPRQFVALSWHRQLVDVYNQMVLDDKRKHIYLYGDANTGKTTFIRFLFGRFFKEGSVLLGINYKNDCFGRLSRRLMAELWSLVLVDDYEYARTVVWFGTFLNYIETRTSLPVVIVSNEPPPSFIRQNKSFEIVHAYRFSGDSDYLFGMSTPPPAARANSTAPVGTVASTSASPAAPCVSAHSAPTYQLGLIRAADHEGTRPFAECMFVADLDLGANSESRNNIAASSLTLLQIRAMPNVIFYQRNASD